ncbi:hypothetical protein FEM48_Zijuj10G0092100 [Ziziphus jujuba var. spinosa]|uniref:Uncharacterized protein n=1 Tax=Ziziphus jujuba var. spinosa TaxID=714518 RepID=A0A978UMI6_ZIZJJ|nr:hypothetical protein FEM48_Zijuj10G0092100 [Ziziphus jujuba var. spinosa]
MEERHKISVSNEAPQLELEADEMNASRLSQLRLVEYDIVKTLQYGTNTHEGDQYGPRIRAEADAYIVTNAKEKIREDTESDSREEGESTQLRPILDEIQEQPYVSENTNKPFEFGKNGEFCPPNFADKMNERKANP